MIIISICSIDQTFIVAQKIKDDRHQHHLNQKAIATPQKQRLPPTPSQPKSDRNSTKNNDRSQHHLNQKWIATSPKNNDRHNTIPISSWTKLITQINSRNG